MPFVGDTEIRPFSLADIGNAAQTFNLRRSADQRAQQDQAQQQALFARQQQEWGKADAAEARNQSAVKLASTGDYTGADSQYGAGAGNLDTHQLIAGLQDQHRAQIRAMYGAAVPVAIQALNEPDLQKRAALLQSAAPMLANAGWKPEQIAAFQPTDENLQGLIANARTAEDAIKLYDERNKPMALSQEQNLVNPATGQVIVQGHEKPQVVGSNLVDSQGHVLYSAPEFKGFKADENVYQTNGTGGGGGDVNSKILKLEGTARNTKSSANGPGQFVNTTFRQMVGQVSPQIAQQIAGLNDHQLTQWRAAHATQLAPIQTQMVSALTNANQQTLQNAGVPVTEGNIYMAHVFGAGGATAALSAGPNAPAARFVGGPRALTNNGLPPNATVGQVQAWAAQKMAGAGGPGGLKLVQKAADTDPAPALDAKSIDYVAQQYAATGVMPALGMGKAATQMRAQIIGRAAVLAQQAGQTGADAVGIHADTKANTAALVTLQRNANQVLAYERTANANADQVLGTMTRGAANTGMPVFNAWVQHGRNAWAGSPDVARFDLAVQTFATEYARVVSGATGGAVTSDSARREIQGLINNAQTPQQLQAVIQQARTEMANRKAGLNDQANALRQSLRNNQGGNQGGQQGGGQGNPPPAAVAFLRAHPQLSVTFDAKYGHGASARVLGR